MILDAWRMLHDDRCCRPLLLKRRGAPRALRTSTSSFPIDTKRLSMICSLYWAVLLISSALWSQCYVSGYINVTYPTSAAGW
ncbi:hypothetical protein FA10DRAFT_198727 [Acaromyces ingoldii]|uniref:Uncharacterized protein n=1 Tax=Acaromyces ingoldii TaxID=215250 RepID=A0A316YCR0_9BASI|nr:hypothetical protein FA10DRAFT_198727 [Acaromyces ingoldii]PWN87257.1 hypothetical protein FA10DRAFT_198727 [Acaromyces ingoldii]